MTHDVALQLRGSSKVKVSPQLSMSLSAVVHPPVKKRFKVTGHVEVVTGREPPVCRP